MPWVQAATSITSGLDADKPAIPAIGDMYGATDTQKLYVCFTAGTWTKVSYLANSSSGTLANLPASPQVGDTYFVTDLNIQAACFTAGVWTNTTKRIKTGVFTRDMTAASGNQAVTGVGFTPKYVLFLSSVSATSKMSIGLDVGGSVGAGGQGSIQDNSGSIADTYAVDLVYSIGLNEGAGITQIGRVSSFDSDGFTISWTKAGSPTGNAAIRYYAFEE